MPIDFSTFPSDEDIPVGKPSKDKAFSKTVSDIEAGKPAPKANWKGQPLPGYQVPESSPNEIDFSTFPSEESPKKTPIKPKALEVDSFGKSLAKGAAGTAMAAADLAWGIPKAVVGAIAAPIATAFSGDPELSRKATQHVMENIFGTPSTALEKRGVPSEYVKGTLPQKVVEKPLEWLSEKVEEIGDKVSEITGNRHIGGTVKQTLDAALLAAPIPGAKTVGRVLEKKLTTPTATDIAAARVKVEGQNKANVALEALSKMKEKESVMIDPSTGAPMAAKPSDVPVEKRSVPPEELQALQARLEAARNEAASKNKETIVDPSTGVEMDVKGETPPIHGPRQRLQAEQERITRAEETAKLIEEGKKANEELKRNAQRQEKLMQDVSTGAQMEGFSVLNKEPISSDLRGAKTAELEVLKKRADELNTIINEGVNAPPVERGALGEPVIRKQSGVGGKQGGAVDPKVFIEGLQKAGLSLKEFSDRVAKEFGEGARALAVDLYQSPENKADQGFFGKVHEKISDYVPDILGPAKKHSTDELIRKRNGEINAYERILQNRTDAWKTAVPDVAMREQIARAIETKTIESLPPEAQVVAHDYKAFTDAIGKEGIETGVLKGMLDDYVTHITEQITDKTVKQKVMESIFGELERRATTGGSTKSAFGKERKHDVTLEELNAILEEKGLRVKTQDIAEIARQYGSSMRRAIENKKLIDQLKDKPSAGEGTHPFMMKPTDEFPAPRNFKYLNHPQAQGMAIHPEIYDSLKTVLTTSDPNIIMKGLGNIVQATKRINVFGTLFHAQSLLQFWALSKAEGILDKGGIPAALKMLHEGGLGDSVHELMQQGMRVGMSPDVRSGVLDSIAEAVGKTFAPAALPFQAISASDKALHHFTWDYVHAGIKVDVALGQIEKLTNAHPDWSREQIVRTAAEFVNDGAGGLDWFGIAADAKTQLGRDIGMYLASPSGQAAAQIMFFAPDWLYSTMRAGTGAVTGIAKDVAGGKMPFTEKGHNAAYQKYALTSFLMWATIMNGFNMKSAGKPIWENDDPTRIELPDGTSISVGKHTFEFVHAIKDPERFLANKLSIAPRTLANYYAESQGMKDYTGKSATQKTAEGFAPFVGSAALDPTLTSGDKLLRSVAGFVGMPIYGHTDEQKAMMRVEKRIRDQQERLNYKMKKAGM